MTKRTRDEETKATVMTVLLEGLSVSSVARECSTPQGTVPNWEQQEAAPPATLGLDLSLLTWSS
jgi:transposase-like protein